MTRPCGCRYVPGHLDGRWFHVVACPDHRLRVTPLDQLPADARPDAYDDQDES